MSKSLAQQYEELQREARQIKPGDSVLYKFPYEGGMRTRLATVLGPSQPLSQSGRCMEIQFESGHKIDTDRDNLIVRNNYKVKTL